MTFFRSLVALLAKLFSKQHKIAKEGQPPLIHTLPIKPVCLEHDQVIDLRQALPWHTTRRWKSRPFVDNKCVVVHQGASTGDAFALNRYHITPSCDRDNDGVVEQWERNHISDRGAPHICYHYVIQHSAEVCQTNNLTDIVWHCSRHNSYTIGVCVLGNFPGPGWPGGQDPTASQLEALRLLLGNFLMLFQPGRHPEAWDRSVIYGHCELAPQRKPACPGNAIMEFLKNFREARI